jgi:hypothetical protein
MHRLVILRLRLRVVVVAEPTVIDAVVLPLVDVLVVGLDQSELVQNLIRKSSVFVA